MKSVLYAGAALMIGAGIYGFVDYKHTQNKKEFTEMYKEVKAPPDEPEVANTVTPVNDTPAAGKKAEDKEIKKTAVKSISLKAGTKKVPKKIKKKRVIKAEFFSRGRIG